MWSSATRTVGPAGGLEVAAVGAPVEIGDVVVEDGGTVVVDDGVVALPAADAQSLLTDATAEDRVLASPSAPVSPSATPAT